MNSASSRKASCAAKSARTFITRHGGRNERGPESRALCCRPRARAQRAGACLYDHTRVTSVELERNNNAGKFRVHTSNGAITAREVILASGAYTTDATPALRKKIIPIGSYIIATEVLPGDLARELSPRNRMIYDSKHFLYYYRLTPDNRMLFEAAPPSFRKPKTPFARAPKFSAAA